MPAMAGVTVLALTAVLAPAAAAQASTKPAAGVQIRLAHSGKCLNVTGASTANSAKIIQYGCSATATNEQFTVVPKGSGNYWIQGVQSGKCLNVYNNSTANNAAIIQYTCNTQLNGLWKVDEVVDKPTYRFLAASSGKCLNLPNSSTADSVGLIQYTCSAAQTSLNEQFYLPPTSSPTASHKAFSSKQPVSVVQGAAPTGAATAPVYYSWIDTHHQLTIYTDRDPDPHSTDPNPPAPVLVQSDNFGYTGRTSAAVLHNGEVQQVAHDAAAGDVNLADEVGKGTGVFGDIPDIGGAFNGQPTVGVLSPIDGTLAVYAVIGGALWYAPETVDNAQTPYGAWRSLGGTGLVGTPVAVLTPTGARIFAVNSDHQLLTAALESGTLSDWLNLGGYVSGTPAVTVRPGYTYDVWARTSTGTVAMLRQDGEGIWPQTWTTLPGVTAAGSPSAAFEDGGGRHVITVRGTDNQIYLTYETAQSTGQYVAWLQVTDPADPAQTAGGDPTAFPYSVPSGDSFGVAFPSASEDAPLVVTFDSNSYPAGTRSKVAQKVPLPRHAKLHPMVLPTQKSLIEN
jgi:hypothetical protein